MYSQQLFKQSSYRSTYRFDVSVDVAKSVYPLYRFQELHKRRMRYEHTSKRIKRCLAVAQTYGTELLNISVAPNMKGRTLVRRVDDFENMHPQSNKP